MEQLWIIGLPILLVDAVSPVLLGVVLLALTLPNPIRLSLGVVVGHTVAYFAFGALILYGLGDLAAGWTEPLVERWKHPQTIDFVVSFLIGLGLVYFSLRVRSKGTPPAEESTPPAKATFREALVAGALINLAGAPFALPYFAFLNQVLRLEPEQQLLALLAYNLGLAFPFLIPSMAIVVAGDRMLPILKELGATVEKAFQRAAPVVMGLLGLVLICDGLLFFATGHGLW